MLRQSRKDKDSRRNSDKLSYLKGKVFFSKSQNERDGKIVNYLIIWGVGQMLTQMFSVSTVLVSGVWVSH